MENFEKIAVLIDADNTQLSKMEVVLRKLSAYGRIVVKKAYGNWKKETLKNWEEEIKRLAIKTEQQFDYVSGKNATDIALAIGAMDLLHTQMYDAFALISSDSDFTSLAIRLRESGPYIIGVGVKSTPEAFRNACDEFILLEYIDFSEASDGLTEIDGLKTEPTISTEFYAPAKSPSQGADLSIIHSLLKTAFDLYQDEDGFANVAPVGSYVKRVKPDFTPLTYGFSKLPDFIKAHPEKYEIKRYRGKGTVTIVAYRCL